MKTAWLFPGQGAQKVGMGRDLYDQVPAARVVFERADAALGQPLSQLIFEGPADELTRTVNLQPALLAVSTAAAAAWRALGGAEPDLVAGHSLGEYSALVAAGGLEFEAALRLVRRRGECMEAATPPGVGGMAALVGLDEEQAAALCAEVSRDGSLVVPSNLNGAGQIVASGHRAALDRLAELMRARGLGRALPLAVAVPFHSPLMEPAAACFAADLDEVELRDLDVPLVRNVDARPVRQAHEVRAGLARQLSAPVLWGRCFEAMIDRDVGRFLELGPGSVLTNLARRMAPAVQAEAAGSVPTLQRAASRRPAE